MRTSGHVASACAVFGSSRDEEKIKGPAVEQVDVGQVEGAAHDGEDPLGPAELDEGIHHEAIPEETLIDLERAEKGVGIVVHADRLGWGKER